MEKNFGHFYIMCYQLLILKYMYIFNEVILGFYYFLFSSGTYCRLFYILNSLCSIFGFPLPVPKLSVKQIIWSKLLKICNLDCIILNWLKVMRTLWQCSVVIWFIIFKFLISACKKSGSTSISWIFSQNLRWLNWKI